MEILSILVGYALARSVFSVAAKVQSVAYDRHAANAGYPTLLDLARLTDPSK